MIEAYTQISQFFSSFDVTLNIIRHLVFVMYTFVYANSQFIVLSVVEFHQIPFLCSYSMLIANVLFTFMQFTCRSLVLKSIFNDAHRKAKVHFAALHFVICIQSI